MVPTAPAPNVQFRHAQIVILPVFPAKVGFPMVSPGGFRSSTSILIVRVESRVMAVFSFQLGFYAFSEWNAAASTNGTVYYPDPLPTISLGAGAALTNITIRSDPNTFDDGYVDTPGNGSAPSTANNDQLLDSAVTVNGTTYPAGSQVELEFAFVTTTGETFWIIRIDGDNVGISGPTLPTPGATYTVDTQPPDGSNDGLQAPINTVPCFTASSLLQTQTGWVPIEELRPGDTVMTADDGLQEIRWIGSTRIAGRKLTDRLQPIRIPKNSFGDGVPFQDLMVSPQHRVLIRDKSLSTYFAETEVFAPAKHLKTGQQQRVWAVEYWHMMFDRHQVVVANGLETESFFPGNGGLKSIEPAAQKEILELFPELRDDPAKYGSTSRMCLKAKECALVSLAG